MAGKRGNSLSHPGRRLFTLPNNSSFLAVAPVIRSMIPYICHAQLSYGGGVGMKETYGVWLLAGSPDSFNDGVKIHHLL